MSRRVFQATAAAPRQVRAFVAGVLEENGCSPEGIEAAVLCADELATNAVVHGRGPLIVEVWGRRVVHVEVHDSDDRPPVLVEGPPEGGGLGLRLVDGLAEEWGVMNDDEGKTVWFDVAC